jgi:hypothetical protein
MKGGRRPQEGARRGSEPARNDPVPIVETGAARMVEIIVCAIAGSPRYPIWNSYNRSPIIANTIDCRSR